MIISHSSRLGAILTSNQISRTTQAMYEADQRLDAVYANIIAYSAVADPADFILIYDSLRADLETGAARLAADEFASVDEALTYFATVRDGASVLDEDVQLGLQIAPQVRDSQRRGVPVRSQFRWGVALVFGVAAFGVFVAAVQSRGRRARKG